MKTKILLLAATALTVAGRAFAGEDNSAAIQAALAKLDPKDDAHWTATGEPRIETVKALTGDTTVTRAAIEKASPGFNREKAGGENRPGGGAPAGNQAGADASMTAALADGWAPHPSAPGYHYKGQEVKTNDEVAAMYVAPAGGSGDGNQSAPTGGGQGAKQASGQAQSISSQTGMGGAMTARSPEPVEGQRRETHVELPSQGESGERPVGVEQGTTTLGHNAQGTPQGTVSNAGRDIELSGEVAARAAGSVMTPAQAPANASNAEGISLGGAADPTVEARAPGGSVLAKGAGPATFFEGETAGGPFGHSGIGADDGTGQAKLTSVDHGFEGDPDAVKALETELQATSARTAELRGQVDDLSAQLATALRTEAQLRRQIEANRPQSGNMATIQSFLRSQQERRAAAVRAAKGQPVAV